MTDSTYDTIMSELTPSLITGLVAAGGYTLVLGGDLMQNLPVLGMNLPAGAVVGVSTMLGHLGGEILSKQVLKAIQGDNHELIQSVEDQFIPPLATGLTTYLLFKTQFPDADLLKSTALGAGSSIASKYLTNIIYGQ